ncbi:MAG: AraC family transcriptional regulator [Roseivirga sp.]|nr:AraC family transcriptional regulator [Roseivirga sp.]
MNLASVINIIAIGQALVLAAIYINRGKLAGRSSPFLIVLLFIFSFDLFHDMLIHTRLFYSFPFLLGLGSAFTYVKGPLILFYVIFYLKPESKLKPVHLLHLLPFVIKQLEMWPTYSQTTAEKTAFLDSYYQSLDLGQVMTPDLVSWYGVMWHLHPFIYLVISIAIIRKQLSNQSSLRQKDQKQTKRLLIIICIYLTIWLFNVTTYYLSGSLPWLHQYYWEFATTASSLAILALAYTNLKDAPPHLAGLKSQPAKTVRPPEPLLQQLKEELITNKAFLNPNLSLPMLAKALSTSTHHLSSALNHELNTNFPDHINRYRVEEAKRLISSAESARYTLEAIAEAAGFNSTASFYRAFRKFTGQTPNQFKKEIQVS